MSARDFEPVDYTGSSNECIGSNVAVAGNHANIFSVYSSSTQDFDVGCPHLTKSSKTRIVYVSLDLALALASSRYSSQPWLLSNIIDTATNQVPEHLKPVMCLDGLEYELV